MKFIDLTGRLFNRLVVIKLVGKNNSGNYLWLCRCECGKETVVESRNLNNGHTKSCGCLKIKHGYRKIRSGTYTAWRGMKDRCTNPNNKDYKYYGGRTTPITICGRWSNKKTGFINFLEDMGRCPIGLQIDRINNIENLSLLCYKCNRNIKRDKIINETI